LEYRILGPLEVSAGGQLLSLGGSRQRRILAALLLRANRPVALADLVAAGWRGEPPASARRQVQNRIAVLRATLIVHGGVIETRDDGYLLRADDDQIDLHRFHRLAERAQVARDPGLFDEALALWRGPVLADCPGLAPAEYEDRRLAVVEDRFACGVDAGEQDLVPRLAALVEANPLRERLVGLLMRALDAAGRREEARGAYDALADRLHDDLGIDPGPELRRLHDRLCAGPRSTPDVDRVRPAQLPGDVPAFTGRYADLAALDRILSDGYARDTVVISAIAGTAGVGKTAFAVHWAHRVRDKFSDGQLHVNLRGYAQTPPLRPLEALAPLLRALGVAPERIPNELDAAAAMYRSALAGKRVLILLDNAAGTEQVRPLLPGNPNCLVLVTSRDQLSELVERDGARRLTLDVLAPEEAHALLVRVLGQDRAVEETAITELAHLCGHLPLALRIAAANLAEQPGLSVADYVVRLRGGDRLTALQIEGDPRAAVRAAIALSYAARPAPARRLLRLLALAPGPDISPGSAAAMADLDPETAQRLLEHLATAHLIERSAPGRYSFHDLLRLYAAERARLEEPESARAGALQRLYGYYLGSADAAARLLYPNKLRLALPPVPPDVEVTHLEDPAGASSWLEAERPNLVAIVRHAEGPVGWLLADVLRGYFWLQVHAVDWAAVAEAALAASQAQGVPDAQAAAHLSLGDLYWHTGRTREAVEHYTRSLSLCEELDHLAGQSAALTNLAGVNWESGNVKLTAAQLQRSLEIDRRLGRYGGLAAGYANLAVCYKSLGRLADALDLLRQALALDRQTNSVGGEVSTIGYLGEVYWRLGRLTESLACLDEALDKARQIGDRFTESLVLIDVAQVHRLAGRYEEAMEAAEASLRLARSGGDPRLQGNAVEIRSAIQADLGHLGPAIEGYREVLRLARAGDIVAQQAGVLISMSVALARSGDRRGARDALDEGLRLTGKTGDRALEGDGLAAQAQLDLDDGRPDSAVDHADRAVAIHRETGHRPGEAQALLVLANALAGAGRDGEAEAARQRGRAMLADMGIRAGLTP
jgi:DNA-binding SARP family transcriptional activator